MKKIRLIPCVLLCILLSLPACSKASNLESSGLNAIGPEAEMSVTSSKTQVAEFEKSAGFQICENECYNTTPDFIAEHSDFAVFKYNLSTESFILCDGEVYSIGTCFGGYGMGSMALGDLNRDGQYELYYTFSWGSGIPRSQIGYFDPACREVTVFDESFFFDEVMLTVNEAGELCVNAADFDRESPVDYSIRAEELLGKIAFEGEQITLNVDQEE